MNKQSIAVILSFSVLVALLIISSTFVYASFSVGKAGNASDAITSSYAPGETLKGWINISLTGESSDSVIVFSYPSASNTPDVSVTLKTLLDKNKFLIPRDYSCTTADCGSSYTGDSGANAQTFILNSDESKILGLLITEDSIDTINELKLNITSNAAESFLSQLQIDVGADGIIDWYASNAKLNSESSENYGCYIPSGVSTSKITLYTDYCETITLSPTPAIIVGANVSGTGNADFTFTIDDDSEQKSCSTSASGSGIIQCANPINLSITSQTAVEVCMRQIAPASGSDYYLSYERNSPCGSDSADYPIFAKSLKYNSIGNVVISSVNSLESNFASFAEVAEDYIISKYGNVCTNGCYIPLKFISGVSNQEIKINSAKLSYQTSSLSPEVNTVYNLAPSVSKIDMSFKKINIDSLGAVAPKSVGSHTLSIKIGGNSVLSKKIEVLNVPLISDLRPLNAPAGADITFYASVSGLNITGYKWNFGDNSSIVETKTPYAVHRYAGLGTYTLSVTAKNSKGEQSKSFTIKTISPKEYLNTLFSYYKTEIKTLKTQIDGLPVLVKSYLQNALNLTATETKIATLQATFNSAGNDTLKQISILKDLSNINLPDSINFSERTTGKFAFDASIVNPADIMSIEKEEISGNNEEIKNAVADWFLKNIDATIDLRVYSLYYSNFSKPAVSYVVIKLVPKQTSETVYAIISKPKANVFITQSDASYAANAAGFSIDLSSGEKTAEFLIIDGASFLNLPVYFSPSLKKLAVIANISVCNFNGKCEASLGEDTKNCAKDCKPVRNAVLWILFVLILFLCAYIGAQEWYKRYYEDALFKNKNDLFNLIHFIDNADKQGLKKEEMFKKLKEKAWPDEQIEYAYRKYKGLRTGMWEIPIFKFMENKKVVEEIKKRQILGINPNIVPKPIMPFAVRPQTNTTILAQPKTPAQMAMQAQKNAPVQNAKPAATPASSNAPKNTGEQKKL